MSSRPRVLMAGESPTMTYLTYLLAKTNWAITILNMNHTRNLLQTWSIQIGKNTSQLNTRHADTVDSIDKLRGVYQLIFMSDKFYGVFMDNTSKFKTLLEVNTIVIVDVTSNPWAFDRVANKLDGHIVLAMFSKIDCRRLIENKFILVNPSKEKLNINLGPLSQDVVTPALQLVLDFKGAGRIFRIMQHCFEPFNVTLTLLSTNPYKTLTKLIWKNVITIICIQIISIIFEEPDIMKLAKSEDAIPIMNGAFREILTLCSGLGVPLPNVDTKESKNLFEILILTETNLFFNRHTQLKEYSFNMLESNLLFYDFVNGNELRVFETLEGTIRASNLLAVNPDYLCCIKSFFAQLVQVRKFNGSKIFHLKKRMVNFNTVNGITPDANMMNHSPFNPLPLPTTPTQYMSKPLVMMMSNKLKQPNIPNNNPADDDDDSDGDSVVTIDSQVRDLVNGYTRQEEKFYDTQTGPELVQALSSINESLKKLLQQPQPESQYGRMYVSNRNNPQNYQQSYPQLFPQPYPYESQRYHYQSIPQPQLPYNLQNFQYHQQPIQRPPEPYFNAPYYGNYVYQPYGSTNGPGFEKSKPMPNLHLPNPQSSVPNNHEQVPGTMRGREVQPDLSTFSKRPQPSIPQVPMPQPPSMPQPPFPQPITSPHAPQNFMPAGYYMPPPQNHQSPLAFPNSLRKPPLYYHLQPTINKNSPVQRLRESHNDLLEVVQFDNYMEHQIPNRYGKYDTSSVIINSGNNSRGSKASSNNSIPKR